MSGFATVGARSEPADQGAARCATPAEREQLLLSVAEFGERIIARNLTDEVLRGALGLIGRAVRATRVAFREIRVDDAGRRRCVLRCEWCVDAGRMARLNARHEPLPLPDLPERWLAVFQRGETMATPVTHLPHGERADFEVRSVRTVALVPIGRQRGLSGYLVFEDHLSTADWPPHVIDALGRIARYIAGGFDRCESCQRQQTLEEMYHVLIDNLDEVVFKTDARGRFTYLNGAWQTLAGQPPAEALGVFCGRFAVPEDRRPNRRELVALLRGELKAHRCELRIRRADGSSCWVQVSARDVTAPGTDLGGLAGTIVNISAIKRAEETLRAAKLEAEAANRAKSEFLSTMSHELRTPLNAVIGLSESLLDTAEHIDAARQRRFLEMIHGAGQQLIRHINDILDLARIEAGRLKLVTLPVEIGAICSVAHERLHRDALAKGLRFELIRPPQPVVIEADERLILQAVANLLVNAVKFTPADGRVTLRAQAEPGGGASISVDDTGIGIPPEKQHLLFRAFTQIDSSISRRYGGSGLGLVLADKYVRLHGGRVTVDSHPVFGSTFTITLPAHPAGPTGLPETERPA